MEDLQNLLLKLDKTYFSIFQENKDNFNLFEKTTHLNATGHKSLAIDLFLEDLIINFFQEEGLPCVLEAEEKGKIVLSKNPEFLVIVDPLDGTNNFRRNIPLVCYGVGIAKISSTNTRVKFNDFQAAIVRSLYSNELFTAYKGKGASCNNELIKPSTITKLSEAFVAFDLDGTFKEKELVNKVITILSKSKGSRRFGANLLDSVYVAAGKIEAMIDIRNNLSAVHTPGLFISKESGCIIKTAYGKEFNPMLAAEEKVNFLLSNNKQIIEQMLKIINV